MTHKTAIIIGLGRMGLRHIEACQKLGIQIVGLFDLNDTAMDNAQNNYGLTEAKSASVDELLDSEKPDIAIIATTADSHYDYVKKTAEAGIKYIFCEKPMGVSVNECELMLNICNKHNSLLAINHFHRFNPLYQKIRQIIETDRIGPVASVNVIAGNIGLAMNGSHFFEIFRVLTGELPEKLSAHLSDDIVPNPRGEQFIDHAGSLKAISKNKLRFYLEAGSDQGHGIQLIIAGSDGMLYCDVLTGYIRLASRQNEHKGKATTQYALPADTEEIKVGPSDLVEMTASMLNALLDEEDYFSGQQGLHIIKLLACAYYSHEHNHKMCAPTDLDEALNQRKFAWA